jgi:hypothetical protein
MVSDELGLQLHNRSTLGEVLTHQEQAQLEEWYAEKDRAETTMIQAPQYPLSELTTLQTQIDTAIEQLALSIQQLQKITTENKSLREEIAKLKQQLATPPICMNDLPDPLPLPDRWQAIQAGVVYYSNEPRLISFGTNQIQMGTLYDPAGKHLKAINKGIVSSKGSIGLVPSELSDYDLKSKILGKGGDRRFHGRIVEAVLYFPGKMTTH